MSPVRVAILQPRLVHYRVRLFETLRERLRTRGVDLVLVHGQASPAEAVRRDEGCLDWALRVHNRGMRIFGADLIWQPLPAAARGAALCIMIQENRIISNYLLQMGQPFSRRLLAFWGHGRNYQSSNPKGMRERWKAWWLRRADWWFAYTAGASAHLIEHGFPEDRVTVLNNAIDSTRLMSDLASWLPADIEARRRQLGIAPDAQVAIYCGSLYAEKRIPLLLESADLLRQRLPDFHLLIVGDGPERYTAQMASVTRPWLHVLGAQAGREKAMSFRLSEVMLNPGLVGLHIVDAFVAATPIVTQSSALHSPEYDYLVHGENGWVVEDDSAQGYADAVRQVFATPGLLAGLQVGCTRDAQRYTLEIMVENFANGIVACLERHGRIEPATEDRP